MQGMWKHVLAEELLMERTIQSARNNEVLVDSETRNFSNEILWFY